MHIRTKELDELAKDYFLYVSAPINREKGKTVEFWMKYVQLIHVYHEYSRRLREGDSHGYISCLPKFTNVFFALNHPNYARWIQWSVKIVCLHWKKHILKVFGNIRMVCLVSTEQRNLFQEIPFKEIPRSMLMQPVRELVLLPWLTQYQHANVRLNLIFYEQQSYLIQMKT